MRASVSFSKILSSKKYIFNTVNSGHNLCFRASELLNILNVKSIFNAVKNFRANSVFQGKHKFLKNPECKKYIQYSENFQGNLCFSAQAQSCSKILNSEKFSIQCIQCIFTWGK